MFRNPLVKKRILQVIGVIALALVLITSLLGCMLTESLSVTIGSLTHSSFGVAMAHPAPGPVASGASSPSLALPAP